MTSRSLRLHAAFTLGALLLLFAVDASGIDLPMARLAGGPAGFPLRDHWLFAGVLHEGARALAWVIALWLCVAVWWPAGWLRRIGSRERLQLAVTTLLAVLVVSSLKTLSATSCPWDMAEFGRVAQHLPHWPWSNVPDGGSGRCFPAGHAAAGFGFVGGWFAFHRTEPRIARLWLALALLAGLVLGAAQQWRGAHFLSHTLYSGWLCWCVAWACDIAFHRGAARPLAVDGEAA